MRSERVERGGARERTEMDHRKEVQACGLKQSRRLKDGVDLGPISIMLRPSHVRQVCSLTPSSV